MTIISNAAPNELDSPYYKLNKSLSEKWEQYIESKGGKVTGYYNAWSLILKSKVKGRKTWIIDVKKATYSNGSLFFSSKYQNLQETLTFRSIFKNTGCGNFCISKSFFSRKKCNHPFYFEIQELLRNKIEDGSLYKAKFKNSELTITFHGKNSAFDLVDQVLGFEFL